MIKKSFPDSILREQENTHVKESYPIKEKGLTRSMYYERLSVFFPVIIPLSVRVTRVHHLLGKGELS